MTWFLLTVPILFIAFDTFFFLFKIIRKIKNVKYIDSCKSTIRTFIWLQLSLFLKIWIERKWSKLIKRIHGSSEYKRVSIYFIDFFFLYLCSSFCTNCCFLFSISWMMVINSINNFYGNWKNEILVLSKFSIYIHDLDFIFFMKIQISMKHLESNLAQVRFPYI